MKELRTASYLVGYGLDLNHDALSPDGFHDFRMFEGCEPVTNTGGVEQYSVHKVIVSVSSGPGCIGTQTIEVLLCILNGCLVIPVIPETTGNDMRNDRKRLEMT